MSKALKDMTNKDLKEYCELEGINVDSKNVSKPTKAELLAAIQGFEASQSEPESEIEDEDLGDIDDFLAEPVVKTAAKAVETAKPKVKKLTRGQKRRKQYDELMPLRRVHIQTNADNQTKQNLVRITWGNGLIGHNTDNVYIGKPWHVREGALRNMRAAIITEPVQDEEGNTIRFETKPAYNITMLDDLSEKEIETIGKRQVIRDASIESLI